MRRTYTGWVAGVVLLAAWPVSAGQVVYETHARLGPYDRDIVPVPMSWPVAIKAADLAALEAGRMHAVVHDVTDPASPTAIAASIRVREPGFDTRQFPAVVLWTLRRALPSKQVRTFRIVVKRSAPGAGVGPPVTGDLVVAKTAKTITVENRLFKVTHLGPTLRLDVLFKSSGKTKRMHMNNDVHGPYTKDGQNVSYRWQLDQPGGLRVEQQTPALVRVVAAGTFIGPNRLPTRPRARFTFTYRSNSPFVRVDIRWEQDRPFDYLLVRLFQWNGRAGRFPNYAAGATLGKPAKREIATCSGVVKGNNWMVVYSDKEALGYWFRTYTQGIPPNAFLYAYPGGGFYMIANWTGRTGTHPRQADMTFDLYVGAGGDAAAALARYAWSLGRTASAFYDNKIRELLGDL